MLFVDPTLSHFLLAMVFPHPYTWANMSHRDSDTLTRYQADRLMSLLVYLHEEWGAVTKPGW